MDEEQGVTINIRIRLVSVDWHPLFREGIGALISSQPDMSLVGTASKAPKRVRHFARRGQTSL